MNLPLRYNIAQNTQYYVTPKSLSPSIGKKKVPPCLEMQGPFVDVLVRIRKRAVFSYFRRSGIRFTLDAFRFVLAPLP